MIITESNHFLGDVHNRIPVILDLKDFEQWERGDIKDAAALMNPAAEYLWHKWTVSKRVSSSRAMKRCDVDRRFSRRQNREYGSTEP